MVQIHLKQSKTNQLGKGADIVLGRMDQDLCPVAAILSYIATRGTQPGPLFRDSRQKALTKSTFVAELHSILSRLGVSTRSVRRAQLSYWRCHLSSPGRGGGFHYTTPRPLAQLRLFCGISRHLVNDWPECHAP